jgi:nitrous oxidase accessory protein NosD
VISSNIIAPSARPAIARGRRVIRFAIPVGFVIATLVAATLTLPWFKLGRPAFIHHYASAPGIAFGNVVGVPLSAVPASNDVTQFTIRSLLTLAQALPPEAVTGDAHHLVIMEPVLIASGGKLIISGSGSITLKRGSYIEVATGGVLDLRGITVRATGATNDRGFLIDVGGTMRLDHDRLVGLGRVATLATITDGLNGVYGLRSSRLLIADNSILASRLDGIRLQSMGPDLVVERNNVQSSGLDGLSLSGDQSAAAIRHNVVLNSVRYGFLDYNSSGSLRLFANRFIGSYDGVVVNSTRYIAMRANEVSGAQRFAVRLSGNSQHVDIAANQISDSAVGVYISGGPRFNRILLNEFSSNGEDVRIRANSPGNAVRPVPRRSELESV